MKHVGGRVQLDCGVGLCYRHAESSTQGQAQTQVKAASNRQRVQFNYLSGFRDRSVSPLQPAQQVGVIRTGA